MVIQSNIEDTSLKTAPPITPLSAFVNNPLYKTFPIAPEGGNAEVAVAVAVAVTTVVVADVKLEVERRQDERQINATAGVEVITRTAFESQALAPSPLKFISTNNNKCVSCDKTVYLTERMVYADRLYHRSCFRCTQCKSPLKLKALASMDGKLYCSPHFKELFKLKGNYSEGFGQVNPKKSWNQN